jgi:hypothetical protein
VHRATPADHAKTSAAPRRAAPYRCTYFSIALSMNELRGIYGPAPPVQQNYGQIGADGQTAYMRIRANVESVLISLIHSSDAIFMSNAWITSPTVLNALSRKPAGTTISIVIHADAWLSNPTAAVHHTALSAYSALPLFSPWSSDGSLGALYAGSVLEYAVPRRSSDGLVHPFPAVRCAGKAHSERNHDFMHRKIAIGFFNGSPVAVLAGSANASYNSTRSLEDATLFRDPALVRDELAEFLHLWLASSRLEHARVWSPYQQTDWARLRKRPRANSTSAPAASASPASCVLDEGLRAFARGAAAQIVRVPYESFSPEDKAFFDKIDAEFAVCWPVEDDIFPTDLSESGVDPSENVCDDAYREDDYLPARPTPLSALVVSIEDELATVVLGWCSEGMQCACVPRGRFTEHTAPRAIRLNVLDAFSMDSGCARCASVQECSLCVEIRTMHERCFEASTACIGALGYHTEKHGPLVSHAQSLKMAYRTLQHALLWKRPTKVHPDGTWTRAHFRISAVDSGKHTVDVQWVQTDDVIVPAVI